MHVSFLLTAIVVATSSFWDLVESKAVFAHYMVGAVYQANVNADIDLAKKMGLDGFALNVGDPTQQYAKDTLSYMFTHAEAVDFKLYMSLDMSANGNKPVDYQALLTQYLGSPAWYLGPNGWPMISTFGSGGLTNDVLATWRAHYVNQMYFIPDFDDTAGWYSGAQVWYDYWGPYVDGLASWESTWPNAGATNEGDISLDTTCLAAAKAHGKGYMIGLSMLQYKNAYGGNWVRWGELLLPMRMKNILAMNPQPDFVQIMTWNDGPESHYMGTLWPESNSDAAPALYASQSSAPHSALQPLFTTFIAAFKNNLQYNQMTVSTGLVIGALWYKTIMQSSVCPGATEPTGYQAGKDSVNWAFVVPQGQTGFSMAVFTAGRQIYKAGLVPGLNYGSLAPTQVVISPGAQTIVVYGSTGAIVASTQKMRCMSSGCPDGIYNYNYQVAGLVYGSTPDYSCS